MLTGKTAMITGANRGIGLATVEVFAKQHAVVWACARARSDEFEDKIAKIAKANAAEITPVYFDVTDQDAVKNAVRTIGKSAKSIDILVNNAGIDAQALFNMTSLETVYHKYGVRFGGRKQPGRYRLWEQQGRQHIFDKDNGVGAGSLWDSGKFGFAGLYRDRYVERPEKRGI